MTRPPVFCLAFIVMLILAGCSSAPATSDKPPGTSVPPPASSTIKDIAAYARDGAVQTPRDPALAYIRSLGGLVRMPQADREIMLGRWDAILDARVVKRAPVVTPLPTGTPIMAFESGGARAEGLARFMANQKTSGILVLQDGRVRIERYALNHSAQARWTSQSVAKSVTSTLVGAAIRDGYIKHIDDHVTTYLPELRGSAYEGVSVRNVLLMSSGVRWTEDYIDPNADVVQISRVPFDAALGRTLSYMKKLPREAPPGTRWHYNTGESHLIGELVTRATGKSLAAYLAEKIWVPYGMEQDASWTIGPDKREMAGCCLQAGLRDYARFGQFIMAGAVIDGKSIVPDDWFNSATKKVVETGRPGVGYGYQWWVRNGGVFFAGGVYGQYIHIDPSRKLVIAINSAWPTPTSQPLAQGRDAMLLSITAAIDAESRAN